MTMMEILRRSAAIALIGALGATAACDDDDDPILPDDDADNVAVMELNVGSQMLELESDGSTDGGPISLVEDSVTVITAAFFDSNGNQVDLDDIAVRMVVTAEGTTPVAFVPTSAFTGVLIGAAPFGDGDLFVSLVRVADGEEIYGPFEIPVMVEED